MHTRDEHQVSLGRVGGRGQAEQALAAALDSLRPLCAVLVAVPEIALVNSRFAPESGDLILSALLDRLLENAETLLAASPPYRWSGTAFLVLFATAPEAWPLEEEARRPLSVLLPDGETLVPVTVQPKVFAIPMSPGSVLRAAILNLDRCLALQHAQTPAGFADMSDRGTETRAALHNGSTDPDYSSDT